MNIKACHIAHVVLVFMTIYAGCSHGQTSYEEDECKVWRNISNYIAQQDQMNAKCSQNIQCTGIDCSGTYSLAGGMLASLTDVELCFGIYIHPCTTETTELSVYIELLSPAKASFNKIFTRNDSVLVPGSHMTLADAVTADGILEVTMVPRVINRKHYVLAGVRFMIRMQFGISQFWPEPYKITLIPDVLIPIPPCEASVVTPTHAPGTCMPPTAPPHHTKEKQNTTQTARSHVATPVSPTLLPPQLPGTPCLMNRMDACNDIETCAPDQANPPTHGRCVCMTGAQYSLLELKCIQTTVTATSIPVFPYPEMGASSNSSKSLNNNVMVIAACSSVAGVLLVAAILLGVVLKYRAHRARYANHRPIATDEFHEDDDDEPLEI